MIRKCLMRITTEYKCKHDRHFPLKWWLLHLNTRYFYISRHILIQKLKIHHSSCKTVLKLLSCLSMRRTIHSVLHQEQKWGLAVVAPWVEFPWVSRPIRWGHFCRQKFLSPYWSHLTSVPDVSARVASTTVLLSERTRHSNRHCWNWNKHISMVCTNCSGLSVNFHILSCA